MSRRRRTDAAIGRPTILLALAAACAAAGSGPAAASPASTAESAAARFRALVADEWSFRLREDPLFATYAGVHDFDDRLPSWSESDFARRDGENRAFLERLEAIDRAGLDAVDRVSHELLEMELRDRVESRRFGAEQLVLNADSGLPWDIGQLGDQVPVGSVAELERYIARLEAFPKLFQQTADLLRRGAARGMTPARVALQGADAVAAAFVVDDPEKSVFWKPFAKLPSAIAAGEGERLRSAARRAISGAVVPAYRGFRDFLANEYLPACRATIGAVEMPDGSAYYRYLIRHFTTLDLEPAEIHRRGLEQVARIRGEMDAIRAKTGFTGDHAAFLDFLRTDRRFYAASPEELLKEASYIAKRMDGKLPALFGRLPRKPYGVAPVPAEIAPKYTSGRYVGAPVGGTQPGWYWVNTYALDKRPLYNLEALTFHEAVPGHHLQGSLAQELEGLPDFRRFLYVDAFGEGWGLYSEWLGVEAGFYTDPYRDFGRLGYEAWRASRLVVDTGLHAFGWSRERAIDYLAANTTLPLHECVTEVDRYIAWPAQALSYYLGFMKIRELRERAESELGAAFDVRAFHDAVLGSGTLSLPALERRIDEPIAAARRSAAGGAVAAGAAAP